jgi:hypothetical protein
MNSEANFFIAQIINEVKDVSTYIKHMEVEAYLKEPAFYQGMQYAYSKVLENIKEYVECNEDLDVRDFDLTDEEIEKVIHFKPEKLHEK